jgi:hypothetical protein
MRCFRINEYEWYAGKDAEEAIAAAMKVTGNTREETVDDVFFGEARLDMAVSDEDGNNVRTIGDILATMTKPGFVCGYE